MKLILSFKQALVSAMVLSLAACIFIIPSAQANTPGWAAGNIISDGIFTNLNTMNVSAIQSFLNSKVPNCDTYGTKPSEYGGGTRAQWGQANYGQNTFTCLRDYTEGGKSAAQIIFDKAHKYSINPQVLIVLLQKEQGLVTDEWPLNIQYRSATGYGCPDTAPCDSQYYGLSNQLDWAAKMFRAIMNNSPTWYTPYEVGSNYIRYNPNSSCGGSNVTIQNRATQALYNYTPYQPNSYALNGGGSSAYPQCGAFGNRNFYTYFKNWFGDPRVAVLASFAERYAELGGTSGTLGPVATNQVCGLRDDGCYQGFTNGGIYWSRASGTFESYGQLRQRYLEMGAEKSVLGYPNNKVICGLKDSGCYQGYQGGALYYSPAVGHAYESMGSIRQRHTSLGTENGVLGYPSTPQTCGLRNNGCYQGFEGGAIYKSPLGTFESYGALRHYYWLKGFENGSLGYPKSSQRCDTRNSGCYQSYERGTVYHTPDTGAHSMLSGIYNKWSQFKKEWGALGFPVSDEIYGAKDGASYQTFEGGTVYWTKNGGRVVLSQIGSRWGELNSEWGVLGFPQSDTVCGTKYGGCYQIFEKGNTIYWSNVTGAKSVWGAVYSKWYSLGKEWGRLGLPTSNETYVGNVAQQSFEGGTIYWSPDSGATVTYN